VSDCAIVARQSAGDEVNGLGKCAASPCEYASLGSGIQDERSNDEWQWSSTGSRYAVLHCLGEPGRGKKQAAGSYKTNLCER
jgi:hypothetical protein